MEPLSQLPDGFASDLQFILPIAIPALVGLIVLAMDLFLRPEQGKVPLAMTSTMGSLLTALAALALWSGGSAQIVLAGSLSISSFGAGLGLAIVLPSLLISMAVVHHGQPRLGADGLALGPKAPTLATGEFYALIQFATSGMMALVVANDLVTFFVALEVLSISVYCLTGLDRSRPRCSEGALKYFIMGAFSSGFLLYGMSLLYGATHTMQFDLIAAIAAGDHPLTPGETTLARTGGTLLLIGLLFKVGAVPFHAWTPDAYQGAPTAVTGFMSVGVKVAAFGGAVHVLIALGGAGALGDAGAWLLWLVAAVTVIVGNAGALTQTNPRRLLAYSAIAHSGYILIALVAIARSFGDDGANVGEAAQSAVSGMIFYLLAYGAANLGAFAVLCHLERGGEEVEDLSDLAGLAQTQPGAALAMTISMISLAGIPCTAGFIGKLWVFRSGIETGDIGLVVLALITSVLSLYYYLRVVVVMFMHEPHAQGMVVGGSLRPDPMRWGSRLSFGFAALLTLGLGLYPSDQLFQLLIDASTALLGIQ